MEIGFSDKLFETLGHFSALAIPNNLFPRKTGTRHQNELDASFFLFGLAPDRQTARTGKGFFRKRSARMQLQSVSVRCRLDLGVLQTRRPSPICERIYHRRRRFTETETDILFVTRKNLPQEWARGGNTVAA
ncbi:hypothetical protein GWI33_017780 [Rhynchophorus ferrugineus]|uniref:Uncharacterized protein n=1 Tax=Rhynchophorus ferrugineus TaxID=354439 RepID=A0A834M8R0_RHYFE|nr:hypothetical protein GWI33_017780 [Rhynchophorus ferrugineus]